MRATKYYDVKITVLKKLEVGDIHDEYVSEGVHTTCLNYKEGQEYISKHCNKPKGTEIFCCADGLHPVLYKAERIEE